jgi:hypothetical protein
MKDSGGAFAANPEGLGYFGPCRGTPCTDNQVGYYSLHGGYVGRVDASLREAAVPDSRVGAVQLLRGLSRTDVARQLGRAGEVASGLARNTKRIPSLSGTAKFRIPDALDEPRRLLSEVKNVAKLSYTKQLRDFVGYAQQERFTFELFVRPGTKLTGPVQEAVSRGDIVLRFLP